MANKYTNIDLSKYQKGYQASNDVNLAKQQKVNAENAVNKIGDFNYSRQNDYDNAINSILNRGKFTYDLNSDLLYNQYKDQYMQQGQQAMKDTIAKSSALTGGYGNSWSQTAGQQTYQAYLGQLNNMIPQLYQLALEGYNAEGNRLQNNFNLLATDRGQQQSEWQDKYNRAINNRDYYSNNYDAAYSRDYSAWNDNRTYDTSQYWNEYNAGYQKERDAVADAQWQKQYALQQQQLALQKAKALSSTNKNKSNTSVKATRSDNTELFKASIRTDTEFRRGGDDKNKYGNYNNYIAGTISKWMDNGQLTTEEAQYLYDYYKLGE